MCGMLHAQVHKPMDTSSTEMRVTERRKCYSEQMKQVRLKFRFRENAIQKKG